MRSRDGRKAPESRRNGSAMLLVVAVLGVLGVVAGVLARDLFLRQRASQQAESEAQAAWLVSAGLERVTSKLAAEPDYQGEQWDVPAAELGGHHAARVTIEMEKKTGEDSTARRRVTVRAEYPLGALLQARRSQKFTVIVGRPPTGAQP